MQVAVGINKAGTLVGVAVADNRETPAYRDGQPVNLMVILPRFRP